jgi:hypothetical protein
MVLHSKVLFTQNIFELNYIYINRMIIDNKTKSLLYSGDEMFKKWWFRPS